jgi:hypothetical protein
MNMNTQSWAKVMLSVVATLTVVAATAQNYHDRPLTIKDYLQAGDTVL